MSKANESSQSDGGALKFILGLAIGVGSTYFSVKHDRSAPHVLSLPGKLASLPHQLVASELLEAPDADLQQRQRAIAELLKHDEKLFARIDNHIANQFTDAVINESFDRRMRLAKAYRHSLDRVLENPKYRSLRRMLQRTHRTSDTETLRARMLAKRLQEDKLLYSLLQERHPGKSAEALAKQLMAPPRVADVPADRRAKQPPPQVR